jgi:DNA-binding transcriptional ArsR family regulator
MPSPQVPAELERPRPGSGRPTGRGGAAPRKPGALESDVRRRILELLRDGELSAGEISRRLGRRFAGVSHHLSSLRFLGLVTFRRDGASLIYRLDRPAAFAAWDAYLQPMLWESEAAP